MSTENKIPTSEGDKSPEEIIKSLVYISYSLHRDQGLTHEQMIKIGVGDERMRDCYDALKNKN